MSEKLPSHEHVRDLGARTLAHVQRLHSELGTLRELVSELQACKDAAPVSAAPPPPTPHEARALAERLSEAEDRCRKLQREHDGIQQQNTSLMNLYVASYRLHDAADQDEVVTVIQEVVANLVGSEQLGVFELSADGKTCSLLGSFGLDAAKYATMPVHGGLLENVIKTGETLIVTAHERLHALPHERSMTVCVPLQLRGVVMGVLAIFDLLPHKAGLTPLDEELFNLLSTHAATSLYCLSSNARAGGRAHSAQRPADSLLP